MCKNVFDNVKQSILLFINQNLCFSDMIGINSASEVTLMPMRAIRNANIHFNLVTSCIKEVLEMVERNKGKKNNKTG